jgi:hypothetical protein
VTDKEIDDLCAEIDRMAQRVGCRFVPDPDKIKTFRQAHREPAIKTLHRNYDLGRWEVWEDSRIISTHSSARDAESVHGKLECGHIPKRAAIDDTIGCVLCGAWLEKAN